MKYNTGIFNAEILEIDNTRYIHFINIKEVGADLQALIDKHIVSICDSEDDTPIEIIKKELKKFFQKKDITTKMGAIAEFIVHLYLKEIGFNQECLFLNLEENSIKKGFDGYYTFSSEEWIMESKSGSINTAGISHKKKLKEAFLDLEDKIGGNASNNPWKNAFNHAKNVGSSEDILKNIKKLSNMYILQNYPNMLELNIIPSSTIFHEDTWLHQNVQNDHSEANKAISEMQFRKINAICINKKSVLKLLDNLIN